MSEIRIGRIYDPPCGEDGCRVLVDRLWPRGVKREKVGLWAREIAPSAELREWYRHQEDRFPAFAAAYTGELERNGQAAAFREHCRDLLRSGQNVTLLTATKTVGISHARVLRDWLQSAEMPES